MQECTNGEVLLAVTVARMDGRDGMLLYASGYMDGQMWPEASAQSMAQLTVGVDSIVTAIQQLAAERQRTSRGWPDRLTNPSELQRADGTTGLPGFPSAAGGEMAGDDCDGLDDPMDAIDVAEGHVAVDNDAVGDIARVDDEGEQIPAPPLVHGGPLHGADQERELEEHVRRALGGGPASGVINASGAPSEAPPVSTARHPRAPSPSPSLRNPSPSPPPGVAGQSRASSVAGAPSANAGRKDPGKPSGGYQLPSDFVKPGLAVPPQRMALPTGRGASRRDPSEAAPFVDFVPPAMVKETVDELMRSDPDATMRTVLLDFCGLYKFVVDTLVRRANEEDSSFAKVNHSYRQLTPDIVRGAEISFEHPANKKQKISCPTHEERRNP